jgi:putative DNA methylase
VPADFNRAELTKNIMTAIKSPKKLIEVALPLDAINAAATREKSIRHGHPSTLHLWWARRPLAAARAVIFAQMVNDPGYQQGGGFKFGVNKEKAAIERERLFGIIEKLVLWENTNNEEVLREAREEIRKSWRETCHLNRDHPQAAELFNPDKLPAFHDPFAGGGALPLEAQRLGLEAYASDLNPVAVTINKAMIEIPPRFAGKPPVGPLAPREGRNADMHEDWSGARGLAEDVRRYGAWMRAEAEKRIGHLYPKIEITAETAAERPDLKPLIGQKLTVIAWLWARTVKSPNPAFSHVEVPLASTFVLSSKEGKEAYVEPIIEGDSYRFDVKMGTPPESAKNGTKLARGANFCCVMSGTPISGDHIKTEGMAGRMDARLMAIVAESKSGRVYLSPIPEHEAISRQAQPEWKPESTMPIDRRWFSPPIYGMATYGDLFTPRQLVALTTFSDLVQEAIEKCSQDYFGARASRPQKTWHTRGYLPHFEAGEIPQSITFRLHDSLPQSLLDQWRDELNRIPENQRQTERRKRIDAALDAGYGECWLRDPRIGQLVENALLHFDGQRYQLHAWVLMPNHVHVLATPLHGYSLSSILHSWKSFTAKEANRHLERNGAFWLEEYFDRAIRDESHFNKVIEYIESNPVNAGLCERAEGWVFGSACQGEEKRAGRPRSKDEISLDEGGHGATAYAQAVGVYLAFAVSKATDRNSSLCFWESLMNRLRGTFGRQALPMVWDYAETNPLAGAGGDIYGTVASLCEVLDKFSATGRGVVTQNDAQSQRVTESKVVSTDPPYYDNIGYADLSDFFYIWLRRSLRNIYPDLYATLVVPKAEELVATPYRHGSKEKAEKFFLEGMTQAMRNLAEQAHPAIPVTIYYAFKQSETKSEIGTSSTGWETFLQAVLDAGFAVTGTWPMRTELTVALKKGVNALASSIVLVCRKRTADAPTVSRREYIRELNAALPEALLDMTRGGINSPVAPVDLSQAIIGPGMAIFSQYAAVLEADGKPMSVRAALQLINRFLAEDDFDHDTQFCLHWFEGQGWAESKYGDADVLARAKGTSVGGLQEAGVVESGGGKLRLLRWSEYPADWSPEWDKRAAIWEALHHLIRALNQQGESVSGALLARMPARAEPIRALAYRLYTLCERKGWAEDARSYNELITAWSSIEIASHETGHAGTQINLDV